MIYNQLKSITLPIVPLTTAITITSATIYNGVDKQLQCHCNKILGTVHIGLSTYAERLLTKVRGTTRRRYLACYISY